jgi:dipicolinate synthase subunit A
VTHLLLPVPSFDSDGTIKGGGELPELLKNLPKDITIVGGNLPHFPGYRSMDLLKDPFYLSQNAYITAHCAIRLAMLQLPVTLRGCKVLIIGWGRIGKCLTRLLRAMEADLTVAARKETDRATAHALGYSAISPNELSGTLNQYRLILNTVPAIIVEKDLLGECRENCLMIDLASTPGIDSPNALWARGLPGKDAPESSGILIAKTVIRLLDRKENP